MLFRVWAPAAEDDVVVRLLTGAAAGDHPMVDAGTGVRQATVAGAAPGDDYVYVLDGRALPDPASRHQPEGVRGPSRVVDPAAFTWTDDGFVAHPLAESVLYELHIGTFSEDGTFDGAIPHLAALADLGVTAIEIMPVAEFPGRWGWGYDGVYLGAAHSTYGGPEGLARLVDAAHSHGLAVVLDVVHNHLGSTGAEQIAAFGPYFTDKYSTWWGSALNYDDAWSDPVREWVLQSVEWYLRDLHVDGLRLDAVHAVFDQGAEHLVAAVARRSHEVRPGALVIAESALNDPKVIRPPELGGWGCDAQWADDLHHAVRVLATGERDGYYADFGSVADLAKALHRPYVHTGGWSPARQRRFGAPADDRPPEQFVVFTQDHDQVGNRALGDRLPAEVQPVAALIVLTSPFTPMLFMGEEHGEPAPFQFFSDHIDPEIAEATREGRKREFAAFAAFSGEEVPDPQDEATFLRSKLTGQVDPTIAALYRKLLEARRALPPGEVDEVAFDEEARWVRFRRGPFHVVASFAAAPSTVPLPPHVTEVLVSTHHTFAVTDGAIALPPLGGALLREGAGR
ncbi:malto-oligosyltrehalose trehalohydrolase [Iamia sp. SCSIO 61187]|uniref:malto-oligosyltrehalose trehalohydrolase n=1 Tax=Iamia sp. SCSIO 61187 TaxID=2722752 RepID=UPI001C626F2E|nr:malto-oligosyltrehalose trehalohydrolase [Iamia sp. SCSIO 61187]QYG94891.1 malto-oligosyltrehalose trehalohydrolase [Iamia sp. SCSIO 61187]